MDLDPGWRPDPTDHHLERWWDGQEWSDRVRDGDVEGTSDFDHAMATPVVGHDARPPLHERRSVRIAFTVALLGLLVWFVTGPLPTLLDSLPPEAVAGAPDDDGLGQAADAIATALRNGRWDVLAAFHPDTATDRREQIADDLEACFGEDVLGARVDGLPQLPSLPSTVGGATSGQDFPVQIAYLPRPETLVDRIAVNTVVRHDGDRWVVDAAFEVARDGSAPSPCPSSTTSLSELRRSVPTGH